MTFAKIKFSAQIRLETGLHIGDSNAFAAIGAIDSLLLKILLPTYQSFLVQVSKEK